MKPWTAEIFRQKKPSWSVNRTSQCTRPRSPSEPQSPGMPNGNEAACGARHASTWGEKFGMFLKQQQQQQQTIMSVFIAVKVTCVRRNWITQSRRTGCLLSGCNNYWSFPWENSLWKGGVALFRGNLHLKKMSILWCTAVYFFRGFLP